MNAAAVREVELGCKYQYVCVRRGAFKELLSLFYATKPGFDKERPFGW